MKRISSVDTGFQKLEVWGSAVEREFRVQGAIHAWWHEQRLLSGLTWDIMAASALLGKRSPPRSLLMLGLAGGTSLRIIRHLVPSLQMTAVEIDPGIIDQARQHMALDSLGVAVHIDDAYEWLAHNQLQFDVVIDDVYRAEADDVARPGAWTDAQMTHLLRAMTPGGILVANLVIGTGHRAMQTAFRKNMRANFNSRVSLKTPDSINEVLVGSQETLANKRFLAQQELLFRCESDRHQWSKISVRTL